MASEADYAPCRSKVGARRRAGLCSSLFWGPGAGVLTVLALDVGRASDRRGARAPRSQAYQITCSCRHQKQDRPAVLISGCNVSWRAIDFFSAECDAQEMRMCANAAVRRHVSHDNFCFDPQAHEPDTVWSKPLTFVCRTPVLRDGIAYKGTALARVKHVPGVTNTWENHISHGTHHGDAQSYDGRHFTGGGGCQRLRP